MASEYTENTSYRTAPLSFAQERLWFLYRLNRGLPDYNFAKAVKVTGQLRRDVLVQAVAAVMGRHEPLRTTFIEAAGVPVQCIAIVSNPGWSFIDLREMLPFDADTATRRLFYEESRFSFDLTRGPLLRLTLIALQRDVHVLIVLGHHIIGDGWSIKLFFKELGECYNALCQQTEAMLPELGMSYSQFATAQRERFQGSLLKTLLAYWQKRLEGATPAVYLVPDRHPTSARSHVGATRPFRLPPPLVSLLKLLARSERATLFMALLAGFQALVSRYTGQEDIIVATPIAGRHVPGTEHLIGLFVNTLIIRTDTSGDPSYRTLLRRVRAAALEGYAHQEVPLQAIVGTLRAPQRLADSPFQVMCAFNEFGGPVIELTGLESSEIEIESATVNHYLILEMNEIPDGTVEGRCNFSAELFEPETIDRLLRHFIAYVTRMSVEPDQATTSIELLTPVEKAQIISWSAERVDPHGQEQCLHHLCEARACASSDAVALVCGDAHLSFVELNTRATHLADCLAARQIGPEVFVGIYINKSPEMVIAMLGVLKAGAAYVPLDPNYPRARIAQMIADANLKLVLSDAASHSELRGLCDAILRVDELPVATQTATQAPHVAALTDCAAYMIYTSGSTGSPKGIVVSHRAICNHMTWMQSVFPLTMLDAVLQRTPTSFDASVWEIYAPLMSGARLVLARAGSEADTQYLAAIIAACQVSVAQFVPSLLKYFVEEPGIRHCNALARVFCGGEALDDDLKMRFFKNTTATLVNLYGPAEATIDATFSVCSIESDRRNVPIGRPVNGCEAFVLDKQQRLVPIGVAGELYLGGVGLARGYYGKSDQTADKFIPHPFAIQRGQRLYKTGDIARYRSDRNLEFLGRVDHQVKIRGCRVELSDIEVALRMHPSVRDAAAVVCNAASGASLTAFLVTDERRPASDSELRRFIAEKLPEYMVPSRFLRLKALPTTPNGKRDQRVLEALVAVAPERLYPADPPRTPLEKSIAEMWRRLLRAEHFSIYDNFFDLGGHSLILIQLSANLRTMFSVELPLRMLFEHATIAEIAAQIVIAQALREDQSEVVSMITDVSRLSPDEARTLLELELMADGQVSSAGASPFEVRCVQPDFD